jgi:hypothetical protein
LGTLQCNATAEVLLLLLLLPPWQPAVVHIQFTELSTSQ